MAEVLILVHGLHRSVSNWDDCMWGDPQNNVYGRVAKGLRVSEQYTNPILFLGGGLMHDGVTESQFAYELAVESADKLYEGADASKYRALDYLKRIAYLDEFAVNTKQEIVLAFNLCKEKDIKKIILVSSPTHISRCLQDALTLKENGSEFDASIEIQTAVSDVNVEGTFARDVVVVEPPHREDSAKVPFYEVVRKLFPFLSDEEEAFALYNDLELLVAEHEEKRNK